MTTHMYLLLVVKKADLVSNIPCRCITNPLISLCLSFIRIWQYVMCQILHSIITYLFTESLFKFHKVLVLLNMKSIDPNFCVDLFWDLNLTWNSQTPRFTECFINTAIVFPGIVFFMTSVPWIIFLLNNPPRLTIKKKQPTSWIYLCKLCLTSTLIAVTGLQVVTDITNSKNLTGSIIFNFGLKLVILLSTLLLTVFERKKGVISSLVLSMFWPCLLLASIPSYVNSFQDVSALEAVEILSQIASLVLIITLIGKAMYKNKISSPDAD